MDGVAYLIKETQNGTDAEGNLLTTEELQQIFCQVHSVTRSEFYSAATQELTPELEMTISHRIDYQGQELVEYEGRRYKVLRTYWRGDEVTLTLASWFAEEAE